MKGLLWFFVGVILTLSGQAVAEQFSGMDQQGNLFFGEVDRHGNYQSFDSNGNMSMGNIQRQSPRQHDPC